MRMYLTDAALTHGIEAEDVEPLHGPFVRTRNGVVPDEHAHRSLDDAVAAAKGMRDRKVASLERRIARLKAMTFDTVREG